MGDSAAVINWAIGTDTETPDSGLSYRLWIGTATGNYNLASAMANTTTGLRRIASIGNLQGTSWTFKDLTAGSTYFVCISSIDGGLRGSACAGEVSFMLAAGNESPSTSFIISAWPNPTSDMLHVVYGKDKTESVYFSLTDINGKIISNRTGTFRGEIKIDMTGLAQGMYLLNLTGQNGKTSALKVIKQ